MTSSSTRSLHIIIVGGGTAGWLAAAYLNAFFRQGQRRTVEITVVDPDNIAPIGVGEATVPTLVEMIRFIGIDEHEFMRRCKATFKQAIDFVGWCGAENVAEGVLHPL